MGTSAVSKRLIHWQINTPCETLQGVRELLSRRPWGGKLCNAKPRPTSVDIDIDVHQQALSMTSLGTACFCHASAHFHSPLCGHHNLFPAQHPTAPTTCTYSI